MIIDEWRGQAVYRSADAVGPAAHFLKIARETARKARARVPRRRVA